MPTRPVLQALVSCTAALYTYLTKLAPDFSRILFSTYFGGDDTGCFAVIAWHLFSGESRDDGGQRNCFRYFRGHRDCWLDDRLVPPGEYRSRGVQLHATGKRLYREIFRGWKQTQCVWLRQSVNPQPDFPGPSDGIYIRRWHSIHQVTPIIAGSTGNGLKVTPGAIQPTFPGGIIDCWIRGKLDNTYQRMSLLNLFRRRRVRSLSHDSQNNIWLTGSRRTQILPTASDRLKSDWCVYVAELAPDGSSVLDLITAPISGQAITTIPAGGFAILGFSTHFSFRFQGRLRPC